MEKAWWHYSENTSSAPYIISKLNSLRAQYSSEISLMGSSGALLPDYYHDLMTGYVINTHSCLKDINCSVCSSAKFLLAAISKLNPFNAVFICTDIIRIFSGQSALTAVCSSLKWIPWSLPVILVVAYMGEFVQSEAAFEFTAQQLLRTTPRAPPCVRKLFCLNSENGVAQGCFWSSIKNVRWGLSYFLTVEITLVFFMCLFSLNDMPL